jgi:deoxyribodipyrimidine photo-lyase
VEPLRDAPRKELPKPDKLPALPDHIPGQAAPFEVPDSLEGVLQALYKPLDASETIPNPPQKHGDFKTYKFHGGSKAGLDRIRHLIDIGAMTDYKETRNGLLGSDFSTKLSAWLALGSITARQVHWRMIEFEDGKTDLGKSAPGYGKGENRGTYGVRFELLWRDCEKQKCPTHPAWMRDADL